MANRVYNCKSKHKNGFKTHILQRKQESREATYDILYLPAQDCADKRQRIYCNKRVTASENNSEFPAPYAASWHRCKVNLPSR